MSPSDAHRVLARSLSSAPNADVPTGDNFSVPPRPNHDNRMRTDG